MSSIFATAPMSPAMISALPCAPCPADGTRAELDGLLVVADEDLRLAGHFALMHAENREFSDERIGRDLEHVRQQRPAEVVDVVEVLLVLALADHERLGVAFLR
jgi:hypothetical protein